MKEIEGKGDKIELQEDHPEPIKRPVVPGPGPLPAFGRLPQGIQLLRRDGMNPLLEQQLDKASRADGRHMSVVFVVEEQPKDGDGATINMVRVNGGNWSYDWLYRALRMLEEDIRKIPIPGTERAVSVQEAGEVA